MLSGSCRRFRARFTPGSAHPHRRACPECEAYAAALESATGARLPIPEGLRKNLRAIAGPEPDAVLPFAVPRLAVPDTLARRLRNIAPAAVRPALPEWVREPRYAVAASALLALLLAPLLQAAAPRGVQVVASVQAEVSPVLRQTEERGLEKAEALRLTAAEAYAKARRSVESSLGLLDHGISGVSNWLSDVAPQSFTNRDSEARPSESVRRPR
jgi:hypothetical protein